MLRLTNFALACLAWALALALAVLIYTSCGHDRKQATHSLSSSLESRAGIRPADSGRTIARLVSKWPAGRFFDGEERTVWVTTYASKYEGRRTKSGDVYRAAKHTVAVPRDLWKRLRGKRLRFWREGGPTAVYATVNDTVGPGVRNFDLSRAAWSALTNGAAPSRVKATVWLPEAGR